MTELLKYALSGKLLSEKDFGPQFVSSRSQTIK